MKNQIAGFNIGNVKGFLAELNLLKLIAKGKNSIPILDCVRIEVKDESIDISATDLDDTLICTFPANATKQGAFCLEITDLIETVRKASKIVSLNVFETVTPAAAPEMKDFKEIEVLLSNEHSSIAVKGIDAEDYPVALLDKPQNLLGTLMAAQIQDLLYKTISNATRETSRFTLSAVALEFGQGLRVIATDGHRLAMAETLGYKQNKVKKVKDAVSSLPPNHLLNLDAAKVLHKISSATVITYTDEDHLIFSTYYGHRKLIARKPSGTFPTYTMVLPKELDYSFNSHPGEVEPVINSALKFANERTHQITFQPYYNNFVVKSGDSIKGFSSKASCDFPQNIAGAVSLNGEFLIDICRAVAKDSGALSVKFTDNTKQFSIEGQNDLTAYTFVIMPLRDGTDSAAKEKFEILSETEKAELKHVPFYKNFSAETSTIAKPNKKQVVSEIETALAELSDIAEIDGMPDMFTEITLQIIERAKASLKNL